MRATCEIIADVKDGKEVPYEELKLACIVQSFLLFQYQNDVKNLIKGGIAAELTLLEKEKKLLDDYLAVGGIPDRTVFRQKAIVRALAAMVCDLENDGQEDNQEQPELPAMTNNSKREAFINSYVQWPVWVDVPETGERYYRYQFPNGTSFVVKVYFHRCFDYKSEAEKWEDRFSEGWGSEEYYLLEEGKHFRDCRSSRSAMTDFLKDLQKKGKQHE